MLSQIVTSAIDGLIASWKSEGTHIGDGIALPVKIEASLSRYSPSNEVVRMRIARALTMEASTGCRSDELRELLEARESQDLDDAMKDHLYLLPRFIARAISTMNCPSASPTRI